MATETASKKRCVGDRETRRQATWARWVGVGWGRGCGGGRGGGEGRGCAKTHAPPSVSKACQSVQGNCVICSRWQTSLAEVATGRDR